MFWGVMAETKMTHQIILSLSHLSLSNKKNLIFEKGKVYAEQVQRRKVNKITMKIECEIFCAYKVYNISYTCEAKMCTKDNIDV